MQVPPTTLSVFASVPPEMFSVSIKESEHSSFGFLMSHQQILPSVEVVANSVPVLLETHTKSVTGSW